MLSDNMTQREKSLRQSLRENTHIKRIYEDFKNENLQCKITFNCKKGYEETKVKLENSKEEFEKLKLILEEEDQHKTTNIKYKRNQLKVLKKKKTKLKEKAKQKENSKKSLNKEQKNILNNLLKK